jgi:hypothetical protein
MAERRLAIAAVLLLAACSQRGAAPPKGPAAAKPPDPARIAADIAAVRAAALRGDSRHAQEQLNKDVLRDMRAPDLTRPIDPERARTVVRALPDVRGVIWLDRGNLQVSIGSAASRSFAKIDEVCAALDPLGDTLAVEVHLQNVAAKTRDEAQGLSRNCQLEPGAHALFARGRKVDVLDEKLREEFRAQQRAPGH